ncbi:DMT family transporter [Sutcliffiella halmapala]|uniref:DMT family transporter n=1 Tax=Sutcliffiella halmapala TaxID=79882 RepID=UPI000995DD04|nr:EamA family transporter [Sutcliffiella halmapala]
MKKILPYLMIAAGASLWGIIALFVKGLSNYGFSAMEIVAIRVIWAVIFLFAVGLIRFKQQMKLKKMGDLRYFIGTGIFSIVFFNYCYFTTINEMNISIAVILLYTAPAFVTVLSFLFLKEALTIQKIVAVIGTIMGCTLIAGLSGSNVELTALGVLTGLGSGLGYALYTIFGKFALKKYEPFSVTFYTFLVAAISLLPFTQLWQKLDVLFSVEVMLIGIGLGLIPTVLAYFLYTWGLGYTEGSKASIIATVEPIVASMIGLLVFSETLGIVQVIGAILILASVILVNMPTKRRKAVHAGL